MAEKANRRVEIRPARGADIPAIAGHWLRHGEGKVDIRNTDVVAGAVHSGGLHLFCSEEDGLIGTGAVYPYADGAIAELASSCWHPDHRGCGGAQASVAFRATYTALVEQPLLIGSELYHNSIGSARVLSAMGFEELPYAPYPMQKHAFDANEMDPVKHYIIGPWHYPQLAKRLLKIMNGDVAKKGGYTFGFAKEYLVHNPSVRSAIERLAQGDLDVVGLEMPAHQSLERWVADLGLGRPISFETLAAEQAALR